MRSSCVLVIFMEARTVQRRSYASSSPAPGVGSSVEVGTRRGTLHQRCCPRVYTFVRSLFSLVQHDTNSKQGTSPAIPAKPGNYTILHLHSTPIVILLLLHLKKLYYCTRNVVHYYYCSLYYYYCYYFFCSTSKYQVYDDPYTIIRIEMARVTSDHPVLSSLYTMCIHTSPASCIGKRLNLAGFICIVSGFVGLSAVFLRRRRAVKVYMLSWPVKFWLGVWVALGIRKMQVQYEVGQGSTTAIVWLLHATCLLYGFKVCIGFLRLPSGVHAASTTPGIYR